MFNFFDKINPCIIIKTHFETLTDDRKEKVSLLECILTLLIPIGISLLLIKASIKIDTSFITNLLTAFSIFAGLLLNLLVLVYSLIQPSKEESQKIKVLKHTFSNISFGVLLSIILVIVGLIYDPIVKNFIFLLVPLQFFIYFCITLFLIVLSMVLKRVFILVFNEIEP